MKCPGCDYELWNLKAGPCPECGRQFKPSEFDFLPNAVKFCCPHCMQAYYGTSEKGQLVPDEFDCVSCGRHVHIDDMLLLPADALGARAPTRATNPWLDPSRNGVRKWFAAASMSLGQPGKMLQATPAFGSSGQATIFAVANFVVAGLVTLGLAALMMFAGGGLGPLVLMSAVTVLAPAAYMFIWALATHGVLKLFGQSTPDGLPRTYQAIAFTSGTWLLSLVPCFGWMLGFVAWAVCAPIAVRAAHGAKAWPAVLATLALPVLTAGAGVGLYVWLIVGTMSSAATAISQAQTQAAISAGPQQNWAPNTDIRLGTQRLAEIIRDHASNGTLPLHVASLADEPRFQPMAFFDQGTSQPPRLRNRFIWDLPQMSVAERTRLINLETAAWPGDITAHRFGRMVMTYHGVDAAANPDLWLLMQLPAGSQEDYWAITLNGYEQIDRAMPQTFVNHQNRMRMAAGLDPLPDITTILSTPGPWAAADGIPPTGTGGP